MTTVTSSTASANTTSSVVSSAAGSILTSLGAGSGIDTATLTAQLVAANKASKQDALTAQTNANTAKISALATIKSGVDDFASALETLTGSGQLMTQPTSSSEGVATLTATAGGHVGNLSGSLEVVQLAKGQTSEADAVADPGAAIGQGTMTLTSAIGTFTITVDGGNDSVSGLASAINAAKAGVSASVVQDGTGYRLILKSGTGAGNAFTLTADSGAAAGLANYTTAAMDTVQPAQDAIVKLDGVQVSRGSNTITDLVPGASIALKSVGTTTLGSTRPTSAIQDAVAAFVTAYNSLKTAIDATTAAATSTTDAGAFNGNAGIRSLQAMLSKLTSTKLSSYGTISTLTEIGLKTNNDGTLTLDSTKLSAVLAADPDGVEALFNPGQSTSNPLLTITSALGATKPGTYTITNVTAQNGSTSASGMIDGTAALGSGNTLVAGYGTPSYGLAFTTKGAVASATITIDLGLFGALKAIQSSLEASTGTITTLQKSLDKTASTIGDAETKLAADSAAYEAQLTKQFTAMQSAVSSYKSIQSYLTQQVALWTKSN